MLCDFWLNVCICDGELMNYLSISYQQRVTNDTYLYDAKIFCKKVLLILKKILF